MSKKRVTFEPPRNKPAASSALSTHEGGGRPKTVKFYFLIPKHDYKAKRTALQLVLC